MFNDFCHQIGMKVAFALVYHPQFNSAVERADALIFEAIKITSKARKRQMGRSNAEGDMGS
jgi:hypothetical protein